MPGLGAADDDFNQPWCLAIENDASYERIASDSLIPRATTESSLIAELLHNERGIRDIRTYLKRKSSCDDCKTKDKRDNQVEEALAIYSLGNGVNGNANVCHGGFIGLMLDETTGEVAARTFVRQNIVTAGLKLAYKRRLLTPAVVLCRARIIGKATGRKIEIEGTIEDGNGGVYATGSTVFVRLEPRL